MGRGSRVVVLLVIVLGCVLSLGGCGVMRWPWQKPEPSETAPDKETAQALMLAELEARYGEDFEVYSSGVPQWADPVYTLTAHVAGDLSRYHVVWARWRHPHPVSEMEDNYLAVKMLPWFEEEAKRRVDAVFPQNLLNVKLYDGDTRHKLARDISWEEFQVWALENATVGLTIIIPVEPGVAKEEVRVQLSGLMSSGADMGVKGVGGEGRTYSAYGFDRAVKYNNMEKNNLRSTDVFGSGFTSPDMIITAGWH